AALRALSLLVSSRLRRIESSEGRASRPVSGLEVPRSEPLRARDSTTIAVTTCSGVHFGRNRSSSVRIGRRQCAAIGAPSMSTAYIARKTARLYDGPTGRGYLMVLIFGDEVERTGDVVSGRERV